MENLEQKVLAAASAEHRLDPDQQRFFLGTFEERLILAIKEEKADEEATLTNFSTILNRISQTHSPIFVKISPKLSLKHQMSYLKIAQEQELTATIVNESLSQSPFGLIIHTDHAVNLDYQDLTNYLPQNSLPETETPKKSFFQKLFGQS